MPENEQNTPNPDDDTLEERDEPVSVVLAEMTGRPPEEFEYDREEAEFPHPDDLESVPEDEW
jgi:hypothetical protein